MSLLDPVRVVEVLSASTRDDDRCVKLEHDKNIPTLRHVLFTEGSTRRVEHHHRAEEGLGARRAHGRRHRSRRVDLPERGSAHSAA
jgi:hypothetical protein